MTLHDDHDLVSVGVGCARLSARSESGPKMSSTERGLRPNNSSAGLRPVVECGVKR